VRQEIPFFRMKCHYFAGNNFVKKDAIGVKIQQVPGIERKGQGISSGHAL